MTANANTGLIQNGGKTLVKIIDIGVHSPVKFHILMSTQRGDLLCPFLALEANLFILEIFTRFLACSTFWGVID